MSEAPPFWFKPPGIAAWLLAPIGAIYGRVAASRMNVQPGYVSPLPTICIGNLIAGGAGKTPTALAIAKTIKDLELRPGFLSRGYGGAIAMPALVDREKHNARDVGDEPLLLAEFAPTVVSPNRPAGARLLEEQGVDVIVMDDGFQNPSLHKDASIVVVDSRRGIGNGFSMPAGPVRARLNSQLAHADALLVVGRQNAAARLIRMMARMAKPIFEGWIETRNGDKWDGIRVLAFAGIADPVKFYTSLENAGAEIVSRQNFHDHHPFTNEECEDLLLSAKTQQLKLVTTSKDHVRLIGMGESQQRLADECDVLEIELQFEDPRSIQLFIRRALDKAREHRIGLEN